MATRGTIRGYWWLAALGLGCGTARPPVPSAPAADRATPITVAKPTRETLARHIQQPGHVEAFESTPVFANVTGYVEEVGVDVGDKVTKGQLLARLVVPELEEELKQKEAARAEAQAEAQNAIALAEVAKASLATALAQERETQAALEHHEAARARTEAEHRRVKDLAAQSAVTLSLVDETSATLRSAQASEREAKAKIESAQAAVLQARAQIERAKAGIAVAQARAQLAEADRRRVEALVQYTRIVAPFDGVVTKRNVHTGHLVAAGRGGGDPLFVVDRADRVRVMLDVAELEAGAVQPGATATVRLPALGNDPADAKLTRTAWSLDNSSRTLRAEIDLANPEGRYRPGMYAHVTIVGSEKPDALVLPRKALLVEAGKAHVFVIESGKAVKRPITIGATVEEKVEILSGLDGTEEVATSNLAALTDGRAVTVTPAWSP